MGAFELRYIVNDISAQKAVALRGKVAAFLRDQGVEVTHESQAAVTSVFTVTGVDLESQEAFTEVVEATDAEAAADQFKNRNRVVTEARPI